MTSKLRFFWKNWFDGAVVTASSEAADYPVEFLQNRWAKVDWRSVGLGVGEIVSDLGALWAAKPVTGFVMENMNFTVGAAVELGGHATDPTGLAHTTYEKAITITAAMVTAKRIVIVLPAEENFKWWRLLVADGGNPAGFLSGSRIYLGPVFEAKYKWKPGSKRVRPSYSEMSYSGGGQASAAKRTKFWTYDYPISIVGQTDEDTFEDMDEECGTDTPLWICLDSLNEVASTIYVSFTEPIDYSTRVSGALWDTALRLKQEL